jgi:SRSO17 transposase
MAGRRAEAVERFDEYLGLLSEGIGHADRARPLRAYLTRLLLAGEHKSVEPMAAKVDPRHVSMRHQSMHHFVANAPWGERAVIAVAANMPWRSWSATGRSAPGWWTTAAFSRRARTRWGLRGSTADRWANRIIARWR